MCDVEAAKQNSIINWQFRTKINRVQFIDDLVRSTVDEGTSIIRLGWQEFTRIEEEQEPTYIWILSSVTDEQQYEQLQQSNRFNNSNPRKHNETVSDELQASVDYSLESGQSSYSFIVGSTVEEVEAPLHKPTLHSWSHNVIIDPSCNGIIEDAKLLFTVLRHKGFTKTKAEPWFC